MIRLEDVAIAFAGLLGGMVSSIAGAVALDYVNTRRLRNTFRQDEFYIQIPDDANINRFSHARLYFNTCRRQYCFDGTAYNKNGSIVGHWSTICSYLDVQRKTIIYAYEGIHVIDGRRGYGSGIINLRFEREGLLKPFLSTHIGIGAPSPEIIARLVVTPYPYQGPNDNKADATLMAELARATTP